MSDLTKFSRRSFILMPLAFAACRPGASVLEIVGMTMGTTYNVVAIDSSRKLSETDVRTAINAALGDVNAQMSNWDANSEISRFNAVSDTAPMQVSDELARVMKASEDVHIASEGRFDTTMGPLIELWGFGAPGQNAIPNDAQIAAAQVRSGHVNTLSVGANSLQKIQSDAQVYLSAIGKGFGADHVGSALEAIGIKDYLVEIGGDIYAAGHNADGLPWQIGIESPMANSGGVLDVVPVSGLGLASSGDYRNYIEQDGTRFSHIVDPATGRPITHKTASATVLAENAMLADAWATAMLTLGSERGLEIAATQGIAVLFVDRDTHNGTSGFKQIASEKFRALKT